MTALADVVSPEARALLKRVRELAELDRLVRERGRQRPPPEPVPLHELAGHEGQGADATTWTGSRRVPRRTG